MPLCFQTLGNVLLHVEVAHAELADQHDDFRGRVGIDPHLKRLKNLPGAIDDFEVIGLPNGLLQGWLRLGAGLPKRSRSPFPNREIGVSQIGDGPLDLLP